MAGTPIGPGSVLAGRFVLEDLLDESDGARFWRATDRILARNVSVHVLPDTDVRGDALLTAARSSALVSDPRLLRVLDAASSDGAVYVVNEWSSGVSLDRLVVEGPLSPRRAAWVVKEVAEAITTAHRNGVAHGRLLPENVMVSETGAVKVIGFVVDGVLRNAPGSGAGSGARRVTGGDPVSPHESDVLNLGGLLYAALVGRWPGTTGSTIPDAPSEHGRPLRPRQVRAGVPRPLDSICERVLNAGNRPPTDPIETAHEVYAALADYIGDPAAGLSVGEPLRSAEPEPTVRLDPRPATGAPGVPGANGGGPTGSGVDTGDLAPTGAFPVQRPDDPEDPDEDTQDHGDAEATQAGAPVFVGARPPVTRTPVTPPPVTPELPERPLFSDGGSYLPGGSAVDAAWRPEHEDTGSFLGAQRSTGAGNGRVPPSWGPDGGGPPPVDPGRRDAPDRAGAMPGRTWLRLAVVVAVVVAVLVAAAFAVTLGNRTPADQDPSPTPGRSTGSAQPTSRVLPIDRVSDFDPLADPPEENGELAGLAVDGKPGTAWKTVTYRNDPELGGLKAGVGLLLDLGRPRRVGEVRLALLGSGTSLQILAAPGASKAPTSIEGLRTVAEVSGAGTKVDLPLPLDRTVTSRWLVVWLTSLPPAPGGFQGRVAEVTVRS